MWSSRSQKHARIDDEIIGRDYHREIYRDYFPMPKIHGARPFVDVHFLNRGDVGLHVVLTASWGDFCVAQGVEYGGCSSGGSEDREGVRIRWFLVWTWSEHDCVPWFVESRSVVSVLCSAVSVVVRARKIMSSSSRTSRVHTRYFSSPMQFFATLEAMLENKRL